MQTSKLSGEWRKEGCREFLISLRVSQCPWRLTLNPLLLPKVEGDKGLESKESTCHDAQPIDGYQGQFSVCKRLFRLQYHLNQKAKCQIMKASVLLDERVQKPSHVDQSLLGSTSKLTQSRGDHNQTIVLLSNIATFQITHFVSVIEAQVIPIIGFEIKYNPMQNNEKKLINIFKEFLERGVLPEIKYNNSLAASCQYFTTILLQEPLDTNGLQAIVDTFPANRGSQPEPQKLAPTFVKKKEDGNSYDYSQETSNGFNPNRTFGGERSRYTMFQTKKQESGMETQPTSPQIPNSKSLAGMENIYRIFLQNQQKLQQISQQPASTYTGRN